MPESGLTLIDGLIDARKSRRSFNPEKPVPDEFVLSLLEAARWAPSAGNMQPWRYIIFQLSSPDDLIRARDCLDPENQEWANNAPLLILAITNDLRPDGRTNFKALHDLGCANENLLLQAISLGLNCRPMGGFNAKKARQYFHIPDDCSPVIMIAIGFPGEIEALPPSVQRKEHEIRTRNPISHFAFDGDWNNPRK